MEYVVKANTAQVWMTHADIGNEEKEKELQEFAADCKKKKIQVFVYRSGNQDLTKCTEMLLFCNKQKSAG